MGYAEFVGSMFDGLKTCQFSPHIRLISFTELAKQSAAIRFVRGKPYRSSQRPNICGWTPDKVKHRFRASKDGGPNDMFFDDGANMCAISAVCQFDIAKATSTVTIVDQYVIGFDIYHPESGTGKRHAVTMDFHVPVWTIPSSCKAARDCKTVLVTYFTSEDSSFLFADSIKRLLSKYSKTSNGRGPWTTSIRRRRDGMAWKRLRMSRSLRKRKSSAVFRMTFCFVCSSLQQVRKSEP